MLPVHKAPRTFAALSWRGVSLAVDIATRVCRKLPVKLLSFLWRSCAQAKLANFATQGNNTIMTLSNVSAQTVKILAKLHILVHKDLQIP